MKKAVAKGKGTTKLKPVELDLDPDAWPKFEALVRSAAKMGHKPHVTKNARTKRSSRSD